MKNLSSKNWVWLVAGLVPSLTGMLLLLWVGPNGGSGTMALFLSVDALGSAAFGIGVAKLSKAKDPARIVMAIFSGVICFNINLAFLVFAGATMFGL